MRRRAPFLLLTLIVAACSVAGCSSMINEINAEPALSPPALENTMAMPDKLPAESHAAAQNPYSTWSPTSRDLFHNKRALTEGDILTVQIAINDKAQLTNRSNRSREGDKSIGLDASFGTGGAGASGNLQASLNNGTSFSGNGATARAETINLSVAAAVKAVLPNGNLLITGSQEVRVNAELRILTLTGVVRPTDIQPNNTISYERIAEARITYGGRGRIAEVQQPAYGQQILDRLSPL